MAHNEFLHAANALVGVVAVATADTVTGGAGSTLTALLSGTELLKSWRAPPDLQTQIADDIAARCDTFHFTPDQRKLFLQMVQAAPLSAHEIAAQARDPVLITQAMLARLTDPAHQTPQARQYFTDITQPLLKHWLADTNFCNTLRPAFEADLAQRVQSIKTMVSDLYSAILADAAQYKVNEGMLRELALRHATGPVTDFQSAMDNIRNALNEFDETRRKNAQPHNTATQVDGILARVQAFNEVGKFDLARAELVLAQAAAHDRIAEEKSGRSRILHQMVGQAALQNAPADAVDALLEQLALDFPPNPFDALNAVRREWYNRYLTKGVPFDGQVALGLARATLARAGDDTQRGGAQNNLGIILELIGQRAGDDALLGQARDAYTAALRVYSETATPQDWAMTQNNLGGVLQIMGQRAGDDALLGRARDAYTAALRVYSETDTPQDWAMTQNNLGVVLRIGPARGR
ncbi:MAG: tetratricopeptide repeat protein [Cypionkella sp.]|nr:tetratricopeptide repeat protein [Cypionkella sp.]